MRALQELLRQRTVAALGTLQDDEPYVSLVPFAVAPTGNGLIIHASRLAAHTRNMEQTDRVSMLVSEAESPSRVPQSLARVTIQGRACVVTRDEPDYAAWRQAYLQRFPAAAPMFDFADFQLFLIEVTSARWVGGFAQAITLDAETFAAAARDAAVES